MNFQSLSQASKTNSRSVKTFATQKVSRYFDYPYHRNLVNVNRQKVKLDH